MKKIFIIGCMLITSAMVWAQDVPTLYPTMGANLSYTQETIDAWEKILPLFPKCWDEDSITADEAATVRRFMDKYVPKEFHEYFPEEGGNAPWQLQPMGCSWYCGARYETLVSSALLPKGKNFYNTSSIFDDDTRTAWVEGASGYGIGEYIEFLFPYKSPQITTCYISNGYNKNEQTWKNNSRVKRLDMYQEDKLIAHLELKDTRDEQVFQLYDKFPAYPSEASQLLNYHFEDIDETQPFVPIRFVIKEVYKGDKYDDTAISEFYFDGVGVHCIAEGSLVSISNTETKKIEDLKKGDNILAYNSEKKTFEKQSIKEVHKVVHQTLYKISLKDGSSISVTEDHPFWSENGWMSISPSKTKNYSRYKDAIILSLKERGNISTLNDKGKLTSRLISKIEKISKATTTYTLELEGNGAFIVNSMLVGQE